MRPPSWPHLHPAPARFLCFAASRCCSDGAGGVDPESHGYLTICNNWLVSLLASDGVVNLLGKLGPDAVTILSSAVVMTVDLFAVAHSRVPRFLTTLQLQFLVCPRTSCLRKLYQDLRQVVVADAFGRSQSALSSFPYEVMID